jgi:hypothetical protein
VIPLRRNHGRPRSQESLTETRGHRQVGVKLDALNASDAERQKPVVVLQTSELPLYCATSTVEVAEPLSVAPGQTAAGVSGPVSRTVAMNPCRASR